MHDMQLRPGFSSQEGCSLDRLQFRQHGPRVQIVAYAGAALNGGTGGEHLGDFLRFGMDGNGQPEAGGFAHAFVEREIVSPGEVAETGIGEERFEADSAQCCEFAQRVTVSGNQATPKSKIGEGSTLERGLFFAELLPPDGRGRGIQRHVTHQGTATSGQGAAPGLGSLPLGTAWFIEMDMHVDEGRQDDQAPSVNFARATRQLAIDGYDDSVFDAEISGTYSGRRNHRSTANYQLTHRSIPLLSGIRRRQREPRRHLRAKRFLLSGG